MALPMVVVILTFMLWSSDNQPVSCVQIAQSWARAVRVEPLQLWNESLVSGRRVRQRYNPQRRARRYAQWIRRQAKVSRAVRRRCRAQVVRALLQTSLPNPTSQLKQVRPRPQSKKGGGKRGIGGVAEPQSDPLAELRQQRGWVDQMSEPELWAMLVRVHWPHDPVCPQRINNRQVYTDEFNDKIRISLSILIWVCFIYLAPEPNRRLNLSKAKAASTGSAYGY